MTIDWSKPIEFVDGTPAVAHTKGYEDREYLQIEGQVPEYLKAEVPHSYGGGKEYVYVWRSNGRYWGILSNKDTDPVFVRNVQPALKFEDLVPVIGREAAIKLAEAGVAAGPGPDIVFYNLYMDGPNVSIRTGSNAHETLEKARSYKSAHIIGQLKITRNIYGVITKKELVLP